MIANCQLPICGCRLVRARFEIVPLRSQVQSKNRQLAIGNDFTGRLPRLPNEPVFECAIVRSESDKSRSNTALVNPQACRV